MSSKDQQQVSPTVTSLVRSMWTEADALTAMQKIDGEAVWLNWDQLGPTALEASASLKWQTKQRFHESNNWKSLLPALASYYQQAGCGAFGQYRAFHWKRSSHGGFTEPIAEPDPIRLEDLIDGVLDIGYADIPLVLPVVLLENSFGLF